MAENTQTYTTRIFLNTEEAKKRLDELERKTEELRKKKDEAARTGDWPTFNSLKKQLDKTQNEMRGLETSAQKIDRVLGNLSTASVKELKQTIVAINKELSSGAIERGSQEWKFLNEQLKRCKGELEDIRNEGKQKGSIFSRLVDWSNKNWGFITQLAGAVTGLSVTIRKATQDYADMEEAMADTRKYTGLADSAIRDLNESLKEMNTRTSRKELNELAGAAGRLGKTSKKDILDFVDAGNMIKVALGDDLGDGAIDKVGKLAMAFGEDEKKGLRGAMLSTGSAINELAQNSSAQAGYLVDFTARVAGFGKQIGLTQAQIMGYGAVMDENLLQDEMAATAFGNMLTKMQTDTEKFARIAGKSVTEFTELLGRDANAAILAVADSLKRQDPTTMMKMLDDMGLDGSRAVGVLSTLADKIDDVRARQQLATKAYSEGKSVTEEYNTMNNTVQANIEKCKKQFQEMTIELGKNLLPVVKYSISSFSIVARILSVLTNFLVNHGKTLAVVAARLAALVVVYNAATVNAKLLTAAMAVQNGINRLCAAGMVAWKAAVLVGSMAVSVLTGNIQKATASMRTLNIVTKGHPWTAVLAVVLAVGTAVVALTEHFKKNADETQKISSRLQTLRKEHEMLSSVNKEANKSVAEEVVKFQQLRKQLEDNKNKLEDRRKALNEIKKIVPEYHGRLTTENKLINSNTSALDGYIVNLQKAARAQAAFNKMVQLQGSAMGHEQQLNERRGNRQYALNQLGRLGAAEDTRFVWSAKDSKYQMLDGQGNVTGYATVQQKKQIEQYQDLVKYNDTRIKQEQTILDIEQKQTDTLQKMVDANGGHKEPGGDTGNSSPGTYVTEADAKKAAAAGAKQESEEKKRQKERADAVKAETDSAIAMKTHEYATGKIAYREYITELARLQKEGLEKRRDVYQQGSAEYEKLNRQVEELSFKGDQEVNRMKEEDLRRCMLRQQAEIEAQAAREEITENEKQLKLQLLQETYLADKVELYRKGSKERIDAEWELEQVEESNKLQRERLYQEQLRQIREEYCNETDIRVRDIALKNLDEFYQQGLLKEEEYQQAKLAIEAQYANYETTGERDQRMGADALKVAGDRASQSLDGNSSANIPIVGDIMMYQATMDQLKRMYADDEMTHAQYLAAKQQATSQFCSSLASQMQAAFSSVNSVMSAASNFYSAQSDYEVAVTKKKYEKQIEAAGNNQRKVKKLQEKQQKEEAAIKNKYAKKAAAIQMAQAVAQTAIAAINAYSSAAAIPVIGHVLAPIAAGMAIAAGMLQIATIKKQQQAQAAGYYSGGFTGGKDYRKEAGVVHEGEFVANHQAVQNPNILPFLDFIDQAQRNNTVGSLTMEDVSRRFGAGGASQVVAPIVNVQTDNEELRSEIAQMRDVNSLLLARLQHPIDAQVVLTGPEGLNAKQAELDRMTKNK